MIDADALFAPLAGLRGIGLGVSGGGDSLALLLLVARWAAGRANAPRIVVYAVDHALRPEAAAEAAWVVATAASLGLDGRVLRWDGDKPATGVQAAARAARYRMIAAAMATDGVELLLTAHHMDDQAETVLMRLAHGSGVEGLKGMSAYSTVEGCRIHRPLLGIRRSALRALVAEAGLVPIEDPSNADRDYERVRWRQLQPTLHTMGLTTERVAAFARRMHELDTMLEHEVEVAQSRVARPMTAGIALDHTAFAELAQPVAMRLLARLLAETGDRRKAHALAPIEALYERLTPPRALKRTSLHGCLVSSDGMTLLIETEPGRVPGRRVPADAAS